MNINSAAVTHQAFEVLVADDDATTRALFAAHLRSMGHPVVTAEDGREAWAAFEATQPQLVIADWLMPHIDGVELCRLIRARVDDQSFVMLVSSRDGEHDLQHALAAGADDYITKPLSADQFRARVMIAERQLALSRARRLAEAEAKRMRWLAGIGQTVVTLQHEINNPLTGLYAALHILGESPDLAHHDRVYVDQAMQQAMRIANVVQQLSRLDTPTTIEMVPGIAMLSLTSSSTDVKK